MSLLEYVPSGAKELAGTSSSQALVDVMRALTVSFDGTLGRRSRKTIVMARALGRGGVEMNQQIENKERGMTYTHRDLC